MKKTISVILIFFLILPLFSCEKSLINDADTGQIVLSDNRYSYADGTYFCAYDYFDEDGLCAAMKTIIKDGIIKSIRFDYFDKDGNALSDTQNEELSARSAELRSVRKSLYTQTLASQSLSGIGYSHADRFSVDYLSLANEILSSAKSGGGQTLIIKSVNTYTATSPLTENIIAGLTVTFNSETISGIDFDITGENGSSLVLDGATCMEVFGLSAEQTSQVISALEKVTDPMNPEKENTEESLKTIFDVYNSLAEKITSARVKTDFSFTKLF